MPKKMQNIQGGKEIATAFALRDSQQHFLTVGWLVKEVEFGH